MADTTEISWSDATFNPWIGCMKVSPGCDNCYAAAQDKFRKWTPDGWGGPRKRTSPSNWRGPVKWNATPFFECSACRWRGEAAVRVCPSCQCLTLKPARRRVFCSSLADVFDNAVDPQWRADLFALIYGTPGLDWLLLTKRIGNVSAMLGEYGTAPMLPNIWLGATIVNQEEADRDIPKLLAIPAGVRFLSMEPLLGPVDLLRARSKLVQAAGAPALEAIHELSRWIGVDWVIVGGESGPGARPMHPDWARGLRDQCAAAGVPLHFKQWGEWAPDECQGPNVWRHLEVPRARWVDDRFVIEDKNSGWPDDENLMFRLGKKVAGRLLDGVTHDAFPPAMGSQERTG